MGLSARRDPPPKVGKLQPQLLGHDSRIPCIWARRIIEHLFTYTSTCSTEIYLVVVEILAWALQRCPPLTTVLSDQKHWQEAAPTQVGRRCPHNNQSSADTVYEMISMSLGFHYIMDGVETSLSLSEGSRQARESIRIAMVKDEHVITYMSSLYGFHQHRNYTLVQKFVSYGVLTPSVAYLWQVAAKEEEGRDVDLSKSCIIPFTSTSSSFRRPP